MDRFLFSTTSWLWWHFSREGMWGEKQIEGWEWDSKLGFRHIVFEVPVGAPWGDGIWSWKGFYSCMFGTCQHMKGSKSHGNGWVWPRYHVLRRQKGKDRTPTTNISSPSAVCSGLFHQWYFGGKTFLANMKWTLKWIITLPWDCASSRWLETGWWW